MKLSIIISVFNLENYISKCLNAIYSQNISSDLYEVILVDDGSNDKSPSIIQNLIKDFQNTSFYVKKNGGASSARNLGLKYAKGDYIWFIDGDDIIAENSLIVILNELEKNNYDLLFLNYQKVDEQMSLLDISKVNLFGELSGKVLFKQRPGDFIMPWRYVISKAVLLDNKLTFLEGYTFEDDEWAPRLLYYANKCKVISEPLYNYVQRSSSLMASFKVEKIPSFLKVVESLSFFRDSLPNSSFKSDLNEYVLQYVSNYLRYRKSRNISGYKDIRALKRIYRSLYLGLTLKKKIQAFLINNFPMLYSFIYEK